MAEHDNKEPRRENDLSRGLAQDLGTQALGTGVNLGVGTVVGLGAKDLYDKVKDTVSKTGDKKD
jgi:hypothetical protein